MKRQEKHLPRESRIGRASMVRHPTAVRVFRTAGVNTPSPPSALLFFPVRALRIFFISDVLFSLCIQKSCISHEATKLSKGVTLVIL
jgi:hypothetical protein